jgi:hypothetical protein
MIRPWPAMSLMVSLSLSGWLTHSEPSISNAWQSELL